MEDMLMAVVDTVIELISKQLNRPADEITSDKDIVKDLGADSLDVVEMLMALEEEFNMTLPDEACANLKTVNDIVTFIDMTGVTKDYLDKINATKTISAIYKINFHVIV